MAVGGLRFRAAEASLAGRSHVARRGGCEDFAGHRTMRRSSVVIAVADGAGSAPCGALGARLAVHGVLGAPVAGDLIVAGESARHGLEREAHAAGRPLEDFATTLLVARLTRRGRTVDVETLHVGDGVIAASTVDGVAVVSAPERGEHANETTFLTATNWRSSVRLSATTVDGGGGVMLMSDGPMGALYDPRTRAMAPACADIMAAGVRLPARRYARALADVLLQVRDTTVDDLSLACAVVIRD
jgi:hypothetical protein